jgi:hypothetical protein
MVVCEVQLRNAIVLIAALSYGIFSAVLLFLNERHPTLNINRFLQFIRDDFNWFKCGVVL